MFSDIVLALVVGLKPVVDAFYEYGVVKYLYMLAIFVAALLAHAGTRLNADPGRGPAAPDGSQLGLALLGLSVAYGGYLFALAVAFGGSLHDIFKTLSPFLFYLAVSRAGSPLVLPAVAIASAGVIFGNALLLPFDYGWTYWGSVRTFKGIYFFKTDLAFAVSTALLCLAIYYRFRMTPVLVLAIVVGAAEVILSNARLNYLTFLLVLIFILVKSGFSLAAILRFGLVAGAVGALAVLLYDPRAVLSPFDTSNPNRFFQGRNEIWEILVVRGLMENDVAGWLIGRGPYADVLLHMRYAHEARVYDAHNELLHLLVTQGLAGTAAYLWIWALMVRDAFRRGVPAALRSVAWFALGLLFLQSLTAVISSFATKTWPIVTVLIILRYAGVAASRRDVPAPDARAQSGAAALRRSPAAS